MVSLKMPIYRYTRILYLATNCSKGRSLLQCKGGINDMNYGTIYSCDEQVYPYEGQAYPSRRRQTKNGLLIVAAALLLIPLIRQWGSGGSFFY